MARGDIPAGMAVGAGRKVSGVGVLMGAGVPVGVRVGVGVANATVEVANNAISNPSALSHAAFISPLSTKFARAA